MAVSTNTNEPIDLWTLTEPMSDFNDEFEIWQDKLYTIHQSLGEDFVGSIVGYIEIEKNKDYSLESASGKYIANVYSANGELLQYFGFADRLAKWCGVGKLPFVGYVSKDTRSPYSLPEGTIWIIIPKSKEQLLNAVAAFYKRRKKKNEAPNIVELPKYLEMSNSIGQITDPASFIPYRQRRVQELNKPSATKKRIAEYRTTSPDLTDEIIISSIADKYKDFFIDNEEVAYKAICECYKEGLELSIDNILDVIDYLVEERKVLSLLKELQHIYSADAKMIQAKADDVLAKIYEAACNHTCRLSEFADQEIIEYFESVYKNRNDLTLSGKLNLLCCNYHCRINDIVSCYPDNFPPFKPYDDGKDVVFEHTGTTKASGSTTATHKSNASGFAHQSGNPAEPKETTKPAPRKEGCMLFFLLIPLSIAGLLFLIL